ncbi:phasin family protein [Pelagibius sp. Alg239-R121]|uniref:phasin family protein n=1 Tax=Pelagibius sp. Alg239-R121 TaxID=2993448 RepID=UPI0024A642BA|nr:phasin family protein [Pelagibius sp. Alg239-R121]
MANAAKTGNPFLDGDFNAFMDVSKFAKQFEVPDLSKLTEQFAVPGVDTAAIMESQKRNMEAIVQANRLSFEGSQALMHRQGEIVRQAVEEASRAVQSLSTAGTADEVMSKQAELVKEAFERTLSNVRELAEMGAKSNQEAVEVLNQRVSDSLEELKSQIKATKKK